MGAGQYEPFGLIRTELHSGPPNFFHFTGEYRDPTGLYHLRARQYDPGTGRFLRPDPAGAALGSALVASYAYAANQPTVMVDPSGETFFPSGAGQQRALFASTPFAGSPGPIFGDGRDTSRTGCSYGECQGGGNISVGEAIEIGLALTGGVTARAALGVAVRLAPRAVSAVVVAAQRARPLTKQVYNGAQRTVKSAATRAEVLGRDVYYGARIVVERAAFTVVRYGGKDVQKLADCLQSTGQAISTPGPANLAKAVLKCLDVGLRGDR